jgi:hypothetical protein
MRGRPLGKTPISAPMFATGCRPDGDRHRPTAPNNSTASFSRGTRTCQGAFFNPKLPQFPRNLEAAMAKDDTPIELLQALNLVRNAKAPKLESLDALESKNVSRVRDIFKDRNIVGIGICEKETDKKKTGELGLCFYVEKKMSKAKVNPQKVVPPVLSVADRTAVFTDVKEIGKVRPQVNRRLTPIQSGFSIGDGEETGTLGAIVQKGKKFFLLSNSHVLAKGGKGKVGTPIIYPGDADLNGAKAQPIGTLSHIFPFQVTADFVNHVDAAMAEVDADFVAKLNFTIFRAKSPFAVTDPKRDMKISIRGRTSGNSDGTIKDVHFSIALPYPGVGQVGFIDQVLATRYSKGGDSGSLVVEKATGKIVGLHFAGSPEGSVFNPIGDVIKALKFDFAEK